MRGLLCFNADRAVRTRFVENCLKNLATNRSVIVSLKILPNLLASFQQFRAIDTHQVTIWAERHHKMMHHFFNNLKFYAHNIKSSTQYQPILNENGEPVYSHMTEVQVRLEFLTSIFSSMGSPDTFRLSLEQVDILWEWLSNDAECADCLFAWLQTAAKGSDQHALGIDTLQHLYLKRLPELRPEGISMVSIVVVAFVQKIEIDNYRIHVFHDFAFRSDWVCSSSCAPWPGLPFTLTEKTKRWISWA